MGVNESEKETDRQTKVGDKRELTVCVRVCACTCVSVFVLMVVHIYH